MSELGTRLNLIQRAMQRSTVQREPVAMDDANLKLANGRPQSALPEQAEAISPPAPMPRPETEPAQVAREVVPVHLAYAKLRAARIATPEDKSLATYNEFRSLKRKLLPITRDPETGLATRNVVMVTSALPREGKTFTVMNLAICLAAERNLDVILVDGDVVRGSVGHFFDGEVRHGLVDILSDKSQRIEDVLHRCIDLPRLHVLFAGKRDHAAPELFASPRMADVCTALSKRFRESIVLFDTPPVLAASESAALAAHAHHLIMLVASGHAARNQVEAALTEVSSCPNISLLFNRSPRWERPLSGPSYYYGYGPDASQEP
jgi:receptor protein-tyrosine kinase